MNSQDIIQDVLNGANNAVSNMNINNPISESYVASH